MIHSVNCASVILPDFQARIFSTTNGANGSWTARTFLENIEAMEWVPVLARPTQKIRARRASSAPRKNRLARKTVSVKNAGAFFVISKLGVVVRPYLRE